MDTLWQDLRYGLRMLLKNPGFTAVALLTLSLGIGANTAIFSLVNAVLFRPLPVEKPEEVVALYSGSADLPVFSYPEYVDYRERNEVFSGLVAYRFAPMNLSRDGHNERIWGHLVTGNYFDVLGVRAVFGRTFSPEEDRTPGAHPVAVLSDDGWRRLFGADPGVIGKSVILNGHSFTLIGVAPPGFRGTEFYFSPDLWVPMMMRTQIEPGSRWLDRRGNRGLFLVGRLKPGVSAAQAEAVLNLLARQFAEAYPDMDKGRTIALGPPGLFSPALREQVIGYSGALLLVAGLVLLIACTNLAHLLLIRTVARQPEIAIRRVLGAGRGRLIRQLVTESVVLSLMGGGFGWLLALWIIDVVEALRPPLDFPLIIALPLDQRVLAFSFLVSLVVGVTFGLIPAWQAVKPELVPALKGEAAESGSGRSRLRQGLVIAQVAVSLVLLIAAGLVIRSLQRAQSFNPGFDPRGVIQMWVDVGLQGYDEARGRQFYQQLMERAASVPGVQSASLASFLPLGIERSFMSVWAEGQPLTPEEQAPSVLYSIVGPKYFHTMDIRLLHGRDFTVDDKLDSPQVAIINETFARQFWPNLGSVAEAVGKRIRFSAEGPFTEIVGVVSDGKYLSLGEEPRPFLYLPLAQLYTYPVALVIRTAVDPAAALALVGTDACASVPTPE